MPKNTSAAPLDDQPRHTRAVWRSPALWLAVLAAVILHAIVMFADIWWRLPWRLPSKQRPSLMVQLLAPQAPQAPAIPKVAEPTSETAAVAPTPPAISPRADQKPKKKTLQSTPAPLSPSLAPRPSTSPEAIPTAAPTSPAQALSFLQDMQAPESVQLHYQIRVGSRLDNTPISKADGSIQLNWIRQDDAHYQLLWQQDLGGKSTRLESQGQLGETGLSPVRYSEAGTGKSEVATHFVQEKNAIIFSNNRPNARLLPGAQDRISMLMQLGGILAAQSEAQALSTTLEIAVAGSSEMRIWRLRLIGLGPALASTQAGLGEEASGQWLGIEHDPSVDGGQPWEPKIQIWYETHGFLPVRIISTYPNGSVHDAQLQTSKSGSDS